MKSPLAGADCTREDVLAATDHVAPSLEILDTRILRTDPATGQARIITDTISDNAANAGVVLGTERHAADAHDLRWTGAIAARNGTVEETGLGAGVLNDPVTSVLWLARRMAEYGQQIETGDIVLSGSFIRPIECPRARRSRQILAPSALFLSISPDRRPPCPRLRTPLTGSNTRQTPDWLLDELCRRPDCRDHGHMRFRTGW